MASSDFELIMRFRSLVLRGAIAHEKLESFINDLEKEEFPIQHALRLRMAKAGKLYLEHLLPEKGGSNIRLWNALRNPRDGRQFADSIQELVGKKAEVVLQLRGIGLQSLALLQERLARAGLQLGMSKQEIKTAFARGTPR